MTRNVIVSTLVVAALVVAVSMAAESVIFSDSKNAGFEDGLDDWVITKGWGEAPADVQERNIEIRSDGAKQGKTYLRVKNDLGGNEFIGIQKKVSWEPDTVYKVSWWTRGFSSKRGWRLRVEGSGSPSDAMDGPYTSEDWTYHEYSFYCNTKRGGYVSLWIWPTDGHCDLDGFTIRKAFWKADKSEYMPGSTATLNFGMASQAGAQNVKVSYTLLAPDGKELKAGSFEGRTPLKQSVKVTVDTPGYYMLKSVATSGGDELTDTVGFCVLSPADGEDALKALWAK